ncbi:flavin reductase [Antrihabitans stalactiti]|uniref:Flavin reductase family protein n=1 Tax=Antrihabitans stalactiti TaxID=2584121 RepID=A0A848KKH6_9NOCA|nr:flavin reductase family protein [Antrihabitans stalactiti]
MTDDPQSSSAFEKFVALLDSPVFIVTVHAAGERAGCLVGFASQVSMDPPRFLVGLSNKNFTYRVARNAQHLAVHLVSSDDVALAELFGGSTGDEVDKFARCAWTTGPHELPVLTDALAWFSGRIVHTVDFGDHVGFLLEPEGGDVGAKEDIVTTSDVADLEPGHEA